MTGDYGIANGDRKSPLISLHSFVDRKYRSKALFQFILETDNISARKRPLEVLPTAVYILFHPGYFMLILNSCAERSMNILLFGSMDDLSSVVHSKLHLEQNEL